METVVGAVWNCNRCPRVFRSLTLFSFIVTAFTALPNYQKKIHANNLILAFRKFHAKEAHTKMSDPSALIPVILLLDICQAMLPYSAQESEIRSKLAALQEPHWKITNVPALSSGPAGSPLGNPDLGSPYAMVCTVDKSRHFFHPTACQSPRFFDAQEVVP